MPDVSLRFESLQLSCSAEKIKLFVTSSATLRAQDEQFRRVRSHELLVLMESGKICTTRGPNCNLDFEFLFKNSQLNEVDKKTVIKEVGQFVLGAPWWTQLPVSPSLKSPNPSCPSVGPELSIEIHDTLPNMYSNGCPDGEISPAADLHVPEYVPNISLLGIKFFFTFEPLHDTPLPILTKGIETEDGMLFEDDCENDPDPFDDIMDLEEFDSSKPRHNLSFDTGSLSDEMLWEDNDVDEDRHGAHAFDDMLLYQTDHNSIPLPTPEPSLAFNIQRGTGMLDSTEPHSSNSLDAEPSLKPAVVKQMTDIALRTLLGGRQTKHTPNIKIRKLRPKRPLSSLMPLIWSPGFKNTMAERTAFLSTISTSLSSLSKTSQLPILQNKLSAIHGNVPARPTLTHPPRLNQTIQAHVFRIMQAALYEPIASRRLRPSVIEESGEEGARSGPPSQDCVDNGPLHVDLGNGPDEVVDVDEGFDDLFGEELLSDGEIDMLFDLEIQRNRREGGSCSMLFGSGGGDCSMLTGEEEVHGDATREAGEEDSIFSTGEIERDDGDDHILHECEFWSSSMMEEELEEDAEMILDAEPDTAHGYSSMYLDDRYINNEAILI